MAASIKYVKSLATRKKVADKKKRSTRKPNTELALDLSRPLEESAVFNQAAKKSKRKSKVDHFDAGLEAHMESFGQAAAIMLRELPVMQQILDKDALLEGLRRVNKIRHKRAR